MKLSPEASRELLALTLEIAQRAGVHPFQVSIGVEPLEEDPTQPFWIVNISKSDEISVGNADLEVAIREACEDALLVS